MKKRILLIFLIFSHLLQAQVQEFRTSDDDFLDDVKKHLITYDKKKIKEFIEEFEPVYRSNYKLNQKKIIIDISNQLLKKRARISPDFINYFTALSKYGASKTFKEEEFKNWTDIIQTLLKARNPKKANKFIQFLSNFFESNTIYKSSSVQWTMDKGNYTFSFNKVPYVTFEDLDLLCEAKNDRSVIESTKGVFNTSTNQFLGDGGILTWERVKLPKDETYAELSKYKMNLRSSGFRGDSVKFHTPYFSTPIYGKIIEKVITQKENKKANYPFFSSYKQSLEIKNIFPNIDYLGGFSMEGGNLKGYAERGKRGTVTIHKKGKPFIIIEAKVFEINAEQISAPASKSTMFVYGGDIISHPNVNFKYIKSSEEYILTREGKGDVKSPFESTFHQLDMHFETLNWKRGEDILSLGSLKGSTQRKALFESKDFFSYDNYSKFQGLKTNSLRTLYKIYQNNDEKKEVLVVDFANKMKTTTNNVISVLVRMNNMGLVYYENKSKTIYIKDRLIKYIKANSKKVDYDNLQINSNVKKGYNATINLVNNHLNITGIKGFNVATIKNVKIFPKDGKLLVMKNRNMKFSGVLNAGKVEFFGSNLSFNYEDFKVNAPLIDSMRLRVYPINNTIQQKQIRLISQIEKLQGTIQLDKPNNKSGVDTNLRNYPEVNITNDTYVYYDKGVFGKAYDRNDFKFKIYPFKMDSLTFFTTESVAFKGKLFSAGIFPVMEGNVTVQPDYSLGFVIDNVKTKIYADRANYTNLLVLNSKGLQGKGGLKYLTSSAQSDDIVFYPDSLVAISKEYINKEQSSGPNVPYLKGENVRVVYMPKRGIWQTESLETPIKVFEVGVTQLYGKVELTKAGMRGEGTMSFNQIEVLSATFKIKKDNIDADTCEFIVKGLDPRDPMAFQAVNMNMHIDFNTRIGDFVSNDGNSFLEFPDNKFMCFMNKFQWFMDTDEMGLANDKDTTGGFNISTDLEIEEPNFFSTHSKQDSLGFASNSAKYDLKTKTLTCNNINFISIADSRIYPDSGTLIIHKNAVYEPLTNAKIVANSITKYHTFNESEVQLLTKKKYIGKGTLTVSSDSTLYSDIFFTNIEPNKKQITEAVGEVIASANFNISPQFKYYGKAYINASELGVTYDGKVSIVHDCQDVSSAWIDFKSKVDTNNILIPLGDDFKEVTSGLMIYSLDSIGYYRSFLEKKQNETDHTITPANGWLAYNHSKKEFQIGNKEKLEEITMPGNFVSLNIENCNIFADGLIDFANNLGQIKVEPIGTLSFDESRSKALKIKASLSFNFPFNKEALMSMGQNIKSLPADDPLDLTLSNYDMIIKNKLKQKKADKAISDLNLYGKMSDSYKELKSNFTVLDLDITWHEESKSFLAKGDYAIANVLEEQLFKKCKVYFQLQKRKNGDVLNLYLEPFPGVFYFFTYKSGVLQTVSSSGRYNEILGRVKAKKATFKAKNGVPSFQYMKCSKAKTKFFLRIFEEAGLEEENTEQEKEEEVIEQDKEQEEIEDVETEEDEEDEEDEQDGDEDEDEDDW